MNAPPRIWAVPNRSKRSGGCQPNPDATAASSGIGSAPDGHQVDVLALSAPPSRRSRTKPPTRYTSISRACAAAAIASRTSSSSGDAGITTRTLAVTGPRSPAERAGRAAALRRAAPRPQRECRTEEHRAQLGDDRRGHVALIRRAVERRRRTECRRRRKPRRGRVEDVQADGGEDGDAHEHPDHARDDHQRRRQAVHLIADRRQHRCVDRGDRQSEAKSAGEEHRVARMQPARSERVAEGGRRPACHRQECGRGDQPSLPRRPGGCRVAARASHRPRPRSGHRPGAGGAPGRRRAGNSGPRWRGRARGCRAAPPSDAAPDGEVGQQRPIGAWRAQFTPLRSAGGARAVPGPRTPPPPPRRVGSSQIASGEMAPVGRVLGGEARR